MSASIKHIAPGVTGATLATALSFCFTGFRPPVIAAAAIGAGVAAGVSSGTLIPRLAGAATGACIAVLLRLGCDDTSGMAALPGAVIGWFLCRTRWGLLLSIVGAFTSLVGLLAVVWISEIISDLRNCDQRFCCL